MTMGRFGGSEAAGCALEGISQLELLLGFVQQRVGCWCETSSRGTVPQGQPLTIEMPLLGTQCFGAACSF